MDDDESALFLEPLPLDLLSLTPDRRRELSELGIKRLGELARLPGASVADRLGPDGAEAWRIVTGVDGGRVEGREPPAEIAEELEFPEAVGNELTLERALGALARPAPRAAGARRAGAAPGRPLGAPRRRWLVAACAHAPRADRRARTAARWPCARSSPS